MLGVARQLMSSNFTLTCLSQEVGCGNLGRNFKDLALDEPLEALGEELELVLFGGVDLIEKHAKFVDLVLGVASS